MWGATVRWGATRATRPCSAWPLRLIPWGGQVDYLGLMSQGRVLSMHVYEWESGFHWALYSREPGHRKRLLNHGHVNDWDAVDLDDEYELVYRAAYEAYRRHGER